MNYKNVGKRKYLLCLLKMFQFSFKVFNELDIKYFFSGSSKNLTVMKKDFSSNF